MARLTECAIDDFATKLFERLGNDRNHASDGDTLRPKLMSGKARMALDS